MKIETKEELVALLKAVEKQNRTGLDAHRTKVSIVINIGGDSDGRCSVETSEAIARGGQPSA